MANHLNKTNKTFWTLLKQQETTHKQSFHVSSHTPVLVDQQWPIFISSVQGHWILPGQLAKSDEQWIIGTDCKREPKESVLSIWLDDDICTYQHFCSTWMWHKVNFLKWSSTGLNSGFSFFKTSCHTKVKKYSLSYYLLIAGRRIVVFIPFPKGISVMWNANGIVQDLN